ncbi:hypothetical protein ACTOV9_00635 [Legionella pneumophila]|uniref:hypothetical protein n=1 Tax=Legionella pneumophila TaxID=446 RepID=UPI001A23B36E|nr:hypothetical protein [Legionella pneumophila]HAU2139560.1 hypothetical protein [Legionella pneumophila]HCW6795758.1 hypothetical protein [Legionella pneumophila]HEL9675959.1 hypothetical protein [Legionella pneumophila]HEM1509818.1 hypothetical protein [Legionella pneumophila]
MSLKKGKVGQVNLETLEQTLKQDISNLKVSPDLNPNIKEFLLQKLSEIVAKKSKSFISIYSSYEYELRYFQTITPVFNDPRALNMWNDLFKKSPENTLDFVEVLLQFQGLYEEGIEFYEKKLQSKEELKKLIKPGEDFFRTVSEHIGEPHFSPYVVGLFRDELDKAQKKLMKIEAALENNAYFNNGFWPLSRKKNVDNALAIFFVRKIYYFFWTEFGKPMKNHISVLISAIFDISWGHDEIQKHCKRMDSIIERRFATESEIE